MSEHVENEMKFTSLSADIDLIVSKIQSFLEKEGTAIIESSLKVYDDHYFDTSDYHLLENNCSARVRDYGDKKKMTVKIPVIADNGVVSRKEMESQCADYSEIQPFLDSCYGEKIDVEEVVSLRTERHNLKFKSGSDYTLSVDKCLLSKGNYSSSFVEIEIESIDDCCRNDFGLGNLQSFIINYLGFKPTNESKYSRAVKWFQSINE